jgi:hypothetical protein
MSLPSNPREKMPFTVALPLYVAAEPSSAGLKNTDRSSVNGTVLRLHLLHAERHHRRHERRRAVPPMVFTARMYFFRLGAFRLSVSTTAALVPASVTWVKAPPVTAV